METQILLTIWCYYARTSQEGKKCGVPRDLIIIKAISATSTHFKWELISYCLHSPNLNKVFLLLLFFSAIYYQLLVSRLRTTDSVMTESCLPLSTWSPGTQHWKVSAESQDTPFLTTGPHQRNVRQVTVLMNPKAGSFNTSPPMMHICFGELGQHWFR